MRGLVVLTLVGFVAAAAAAESSSASRHGGAATRPELGSTGILRPLIAMVMPANITAHGGAATVSGILGYCSGKAARAVTGGVSLGVGIAFIALSILSKAGFISINYTELERYILSLADFNKDGKLDRDDYTFASQKLVHLLTDHGLSSVSGFAAGFAAGYKQD